MLDPRDKSDGVCEHPEHVIVVGVDLAVRMLGRIERGEGEGPSVRLLGDVAMNEDVALGGGAVMTYLRTRESEHPRQRI